MNKAIIFILALLNVCHTISAASFNEAQIPEIIITDVSYDYHPVASFNSIPSFSGTLSFTMELNDMPDLIVIGKTNSHLNDEDRKFMAVKYPITDSSFSDKVLFTLENIDWGTYINATWRKKDGRYVISNMICSSDYLSEADKTLVAPYLASIETVQENNILSICGREITMNGCQRGILSAYSVEGKHLFTSEITEKIPLRLPLDLPNIVILQVTLSERTIIKKIQI